MQTAFGNSSSVVKPGTKPSSLGFVPGEAEIMMGMYHPEGGTTGEFGIRWAMLDNRSVPQLQVYEDGWSALLKFQDVLNRLAELDGTCPTVSQIAEVLKACGIQDATERVREQ